ncbi:hypothetical protein HDU77_006664 [Chytriomyces hyalinus]|nr:hypothetical protein HDU77_006664 [Chytriomyces hyalinus]
MDELETALLTANKNSLSDVGSVLDRMDAVLGAAVESERDPTSGLGRQTVPPETQRRMGGWVTGAVAAMVRLQARNQDPRVDEMLDRLAALNADIARLTGDAPALVKTWRFTENLAVDIKELSFEEAAFGWQTWVAGVVFAHLLARGVIPVGTDPILELGCGTGIVGIVAAKMGAKRVFMTDYMPAIQANAQSNVDSNQCQHVATVHSLDWSWIAENTPIPKDSATLLPQLLDTNSSFDVIFGADICYELIHGRLVPPVCARFLSLSPKARIYFVTGLRGERFAQDVVQFEEQMALFGFQPETCLDLSLDALLAQETDSFARNLLNAAFSTLVKQFRFYVYRRIMT